MVDIEKKIVNKKEKDYYYHGSDVTPCIKIDKTLVVYIFSKVM